MLECSFLWANWVFLIVKKSAFLKEVGGDQMVKWHLRTWFLSVTIVIGPPLSALRTTEGGLQWPMEAGH